MALQVMPAYQQAEQTNAGSVSDLLTAWQANAASVGHSAWNSIGRSYTFVVWFLALCALLILSDWQPALAGKLAMLLFIAVFVRVVAEGKF